MEGVSAQHARVGNRITSALVSLYDPGRIPPDGWNRFLLRLRTENFRYKPEDCFESQLKSLDPYHRLPFVVIGAPAFDQPVFDVAQGWRSPQFHRIWASSMAVPSTV